MRTKKSFFAQHAKSSAAMISLGIHAVLIVVALSFVAVTVIQKEESSFEAKPVSRPRKHLKKLQVPVTIKKKEVRKPKLRKRIVVQPKLNQTMPDIRMPEISGVRGGMGSAGAGGLGGEGGLGFTMPELNLFGVKSRGEKVFLILDSSAEIMKDEMGGISAYTLVKEELIRIIDELSPTTLFNIAVYERSKASMLFPQLVAASHESVEKVKSWLDPLNVWSEGMGNLNYGIKTLGPGGQLVGNELVLEPLEIGSEWVRPSLYAMQQGADAIFVLGTGWGHQGHLVKGGEMSPSEQKKYKEYVKKAQKLHEEENSRRTSRGDPPRVLAGDNGLVRAYFPEVRFAEKEERETRNYTPREITGVMKEVRKNSKSTVVQTNSGLRKRQENNGYTLNIIQFTRKSGADARQTEPFKKMADLNGGKYRAISGMDAIKRSISGAE